MAAPRRWARVSLVGAVRDETVSPEVAALLIARDARPELDIDAQLETNQFAMQLGAFALFR